MNISRRQHYIHAALFWAVTGFVMGFFGVKWVWFGFSPPWVFFWIGLCLVLGLSKGELAIGKSAKRAVLRIKNFSERSPFFHTFSKGQWILIMAMMGLGMVIRFSGIEKSYRGLVLATIGIALLWASRFFWKAACKSS